MPPQDVLDALNAWATSLTTLSADTIAQQSTAAALTTAKQADDDAKAKVTSDTQDTQAKEADLIAKIQAHSPPAAQMVQKALKARKAGGKVDWASLLVQVLAALMQAFGKQSP